MKYKIMSLGLLLLAVNAFGLTWIDSLQSPGYSYDVAVSGDYAYIADGNKGLYIVDISDPADMAPVCSLSMPGNAWAKSVYISGDYAYLACGSTGIFIVDISDPLSPSVTGSFNTPGTANSVYTKDNYVFVADGSKGICIIDVTDPADPIGVDTLGGFHGSVDNICISGNHAYAVTYYGFYIVDINVPGASVLVDSVSGTYNPALGVSDGYAYVNRNSGFCVIDISTPAEPAIVCTLGNAYGFKDIFIKGDAAYASGGSRGSYVFDISSPASPQEADSYDLLGNPQGSFVSGDHIYVATESYGLFAGSIGSTGIDATVAARQNNTKLSVCSGFSGQDTRFSFAVQYQGKVRMDIYNAQGNLIKNLVNGNYGQGVHRADWNGMSDNNRRVGPGMYIARLLVGQDVVTQKVSIIK